MLRLQVKVERYNVFLTPEAVALLPKGEPEVGLWRLRGRGAKHAEHPLKLYGIRSVGPIKLGKGLVVPERIAAYEVCPMPHMSRSAFAASLTCHLWALVCTACCPASCM